MKRTLLLTLLWLVFLAGSAYAEERNLIGGRSYTCCPNPNYALCTDEDDAIQLSDGVSRSGKIWVQKSCVGWYGADAGVVMLFDLGETGTLSSLRFNTVGGGGADVNYPGLEVYVSLDGERYVLAGESSAPPVPPKDKWTTHVRQIEVPLKGINGRYVAIRAFPPKFYLYVFVDEIEIVGQTPARGDVSVPALSTIVSASGAKGLQEALAAKRDMVMLVGSLTAPIERHIGCWPAAAAAGQHEDLKQFQQRAIVESENYKALRAGFTERHRVRAGEVYDAKTLVWEIVPDEQFTMLSLPEVLTPSQSSSIHTVINALEAAAFGAANLSETERPLEVSVSGHVPGAPAITPRIARFFVTGNAKKHVPDALIANDCPQVIPPGESKLVWLGVEGRDAMPGIYKYDIEVKIGDQVHRSPLQVQVHNITLSENTPLGTANWAYLDTGEKPLYREVRDSMLDHRITIGAAGHAGCFPKIDAQGKMLQPMQVDFTALDKLLAFHKDFPQISMYLPFNYIVRKQNSRRFGEAQWGSSGFDERFGEWLTRLVEHIKASGRDYNEFYFQLIDESVDPKVGELCKLVRSVDPNVRVMITSHSDASAETLTGMVESGMNVFIHQGMPGYDNAPSGYPLFSSGEGRELHLYWAGDRRNYHGRERDPLNIYRLMHWRAFRHKATGVHFWNMLQDRVSGWADNVTYWPFVYTNQENDPDVPADVETAEKVIASRRWEYARMGIEDYMLLKMAQEKIESLGTSGTSYQQKLDEIVKTVLTSRAEDRYLFRAKRRELVDLVEALVSKVK